MRKILSFLVVAFAFMLPAFVSADEIRPVCGEKDANGVRTCTVTYSITDVKESLTVTLTEQGGAEIISIEDDIDSDWTISSKAENNSVWTVLVVSPGVSGEGNLFTFKYQESGTADCKVVIGLGDKTVETPNDETPSTTPDQPEENKDTGATLPYIALGAVLLVAAGAYVGTKNKSKMYKI